jgi:hypothetical protein
MLSLIFLPRLAKERKLNKMLLSLVYFLAIFR